MPEAESAGGEFRARSTRRRGVWLGTAALIAALAAVSVGFAMRAAHTRAANPSECTGAQSFDGDCFVARYTALTRRAGAKTALADLIEQRRSNEYLGAACHQLTHVVGRTAGEAYGKAAFVQGTDVCASGYYHGVIEAVMMSLGPGQVLDRAQSVCADEREHAAYSYPHYNCVHGMGHGFMAVFGSDIFQSLPGCDQLPDTWERHHCYGGVFMENLTALGNAARPSRFARPDEPLYPCTAVDTPYKGECYIKQTAYALLVSHEDFGAVFRLCRDEADADFRTVCYEGLGGDAAIKTSKFVIGEAARADTLRKLCLQGPDAEAQKHCVIGAVATIVRDLAGDDAQARALCTALADHPMAGVCESTRTAAVDEFPEGRGGGHRH